MIKFHYYFLLKMFLCSEQECFKAILDYFKIDYELLIVYLLLFLSFLILLIICFYIYKYLMQRYCYKKEVSNQSNELVYV